MPHERVPPRTHLYFFDSSGSPWSTDTSVRSRGGTGRVLVLAGIAGVAAAIGAAFFVLDGQAPAIPRGDDPYTDIYGRPIRTELKPIPYSGDAAVMSESGESHNPAFDTPADRELRYKDPLAYYEKFYAGMTRGKLHIVDPALYEQLRRKGLLEHVPLKAPYVPPESLPAEVRARHHGPSMDSPDDRLLRLNDPVAYYHKYYHGIPRGQLKQLDPALYKMLRLKGGLLAVPMS